MSIYLNTPDSMGLALAKNVENQLRLSGKEGWGSYLGKQAAATVAHPVVAMANLIAAPALSALAILSSPLAVTTWGRENVALPLFKRAEQTALAASRALTNTFVGNAKHYGDVEVKPQVEVEVQEETEEPTRLDQTKAFAKRHWKPLLGGVFALGVAIYILKSCSATTPNSPPQPPQPPVDNQGTCGLYDNFEMCGLEEGTSPAYQLEFPESSQQNMTEQGNVTANLTAPQSAVNGTNVAEQGNVTANITGFNNQSSTSNQTQGSLWNRFITFMGYGPSSQSNGTEALKNSSIANKTITNLTAPQSAVNGTDVAEQGNVTANITGFNNQSSASNQTQNGTWANVSSFINGSSSNRTEALKNSSITNRTIENITVPQPAVNETIKDSGVSIGGNKTALENGFCPEEISSNRTFSSAGLPLSGFSSSQEHVNSTKKNDEFGFCSATENLEDSSKAKASSEIRLTFGGASKICDQTLINIGRDFFRKCSEFRETTIEKDGIKQSNKERTRDFFEFIGKQV